MRKTERESAGNLDPESVRERALDSHHDIRAQLRRMLALAARVKHADGSAAIDLTTAMKKLALAVRCHVARERAEVVELLERMDGWGASHKALLQKDHDAEIDAVFNVDYYGSHVAMAEDAAAIARALSAALRHEEEAILTPDLVARARSAAR